MRHAHRTGRGPRSRLRVALIAVLAAVFCVSHVSGPRRAVALDRGAERVVIVVTTDLDWRTVDSRRAPTLHRLMTRGTLADVAVRRLVGLSPKITAPSQAGLTLSAGAWTLPAPRALAAYDASESLNGRSATQAYGALYGRSPGDAAVVYLGHDAAQRDQNAASQGAKLGTLGHAFEAAGGGVGAVGNSDWGNGFPRNPERPAGVIAADERGLALGGSVSPSLLVTDTSAPYGVRTDAVAFDAAYEQAMGTLGGRPGPQLLVLDVGDGYRATRARQESAGRGAEWNEQALTTLEHVVWTASSSLAPSDLLMVVSIPTAVGASQQGFGSALLSGRSYSERPALGTSSSTRRIGLVTLPDLTATALDAAGIAVPSAVAGSAVSAVPEAVPASGRIGRIAELERTAVVVQEVKYTVVTWYAALTLIVTALAVAFGTLRRRVSIRAQRTGTVLLHALVLLAASVPAGLWLAFAIVRLPQTTRTLAAASAGGILTLWVVALVVRVFASPRSALAVVGMITALVLAGEQWFGSPLSFAIPLAYTPLEGARFYGIGNEAAAFMMGGLLVGLAMLADGWPRRMQRSVGRQTVAWLIAALGAAAVASAALPSAGANIGVAAWGTVAVVLAWRLVGGGSLTWRLLLAAALAAAASVAVIAWVNVALSSGRTHVGQAVSGVESGGVAALWSIAARKALRSVHYLAQTVWTWVFVLIYAVFAYVRVRPRGLAKRVFDSSPAFAAVASALLVAGAVGMFTEDSGIVMPIVLFVFMFLGFALIASADGERAILDKRSASDEPDSDQASVKAPAGEGGS